MSDPSRKVTDAEAAALKSAVLEGLRTIRDKVDAELERRIRRQEWFSRAIVVALGAGAVALGVAWYTSRKSRKGKK